MAHETGFLHLLTPLLTGDVHGVLRSCGLFLADMSDYLAVLNFENPGENA